MEKDYKVETKHEIWWVQINQGSYSDYTEKNFYISANDAEEAWFLFKKYIGDIEEHKESSITYSSEVWQGPKHNEYSWQRWECKITPLNVIYFKR